MLHETYTFMSPEDGMRYLYFPRGRDYGYHRMDFIKPLVFGEDGYEETDVRLRGLPLLSVDFSSLCRLPPLANNQSFVPIYVVRTEHFLTKCIRFREGQKYIFGITATNPIEGLNFQEDAFAVSNFNKFNLDGMNLSI